MLLDYFSFVFCSDFVAQEDGLGSNTREDVVTISLQGVAKRFGSFQAVQNIDLEIKTGTLVALLGPSGCGKSTLLRLIAGLETPDQGKIWLSGQDATQQKLQDRNIGFVFQHYALFKHLTVRENIAFGLSVRKASKKVMEERVSQLLELVQLSGMENRYPAQLSGGQRQRVALARALAIEPSVLLLDEPFGALDAKVRKDLRQWLRRLHDEVHVTTIFVTHDPDEAMEVSDEIVVMSKGKVEQVGTPAQIYDQPASAFVMGFLGPVNQLHNAWELFPGVSQTALEVFIRPHDLTVSHHQPGASAKVQRLIHLGWQVQVELLLEDGQSLTALLNREQARDLAVDQAVFVQALNPKSFPLKPVLTDLLLQTPA